MARTRGPSGSFRTMVIFLLFLFAFRIQAQGNNNNNNNNNNNPKQTTTQKGDNPAPKPSSSAGPADKPNETSDKPPTTTNDLPNLSITNAPALSSTKSASAFRLTDLPTLGGALFPTIVVPNTAGAPFMQKSTLPEGTVFICVGAILGFLGASVLAWRGLVAWSLHRSVRRAAVAQKSMDSKALLRGAPSKGMYSHAGVSSTLSLDHLASPVPVRASKYHSGPTNTPPKHSAPAPSSLFFSPTAGTGLHSSTNRSSSYLPAGYYAPGSSAPASGAQMMHVGGPPGPLSMGPSAAGYTRTRSVGPSPPSSPGLPPSRGNESMMGGYARSSMVGNVGPSGLYSQQSVSSLNLSATPLHQGRAPSAYLEDLFENHGSGPRERY